MTAEPASLARNTSYFTLALVGQKVISFLYFTFLARLLGPAAIGKYVFALSITTVFSVFLDLGLASLLTREVARDEKSAEPYVRLVIGFKLLAALLVVAMAAAFVVLIGYPSLTRQLVYLATFVMVLDSFTLTAYSTIRGFHNLLWESVGTVLMQFTAAAGGLVVSLFSHDLRWFMSALAVASAVNCWFGWRQLKRHYGIKFQPRYNLFDFKRLAKLTWPFALAAVLTRFYGYIDAVILSLLSGDKAVGIYSVAYKITFALQFIPAAFSASLFPGFSTYFTESPAKLASTFSRGVVYLTALAVPISFGIIALAPELVMAIYPAFAQAILPLQILIFSLVFLFLTFPLGALLPACNLPMRQTGNLALAAGLNFILNILLIPRWGPTGAAVASLASTIVLLVAGWLVARRLVKLDGRWLALKLAKLVAAGCVMFIMALWLKSYLYFALVIPLAGTIYLVLIIWLRAVTWQEIRQLLNLLIRPRPA